ncbi:SwmB domain-containing protein [Caulobacter sp. NIBR2454]|uniref:SwmB domain-containing protein n=1 Tax=Caulobacter sp. NIBR2454 TaxID=3015996 RepID=UPI0022B70185|nr:SwmB domain-containing protein [Caulobacter sp. NIBR2454]
MSSIVFARAETGFDKKSWQGERASSGLEGADAGPLKAMTLAASAFADPAPRLQAMTAFDEVILLDFDSALPFEPLPAVGQFTVRVNGAVVGIDRLSVAENGHMLVLILDNRVSGGAEVSVAYTDVSSQDDPVTLQGVTGSDVANFQAQTRTEGEPDAAPQLQSTTLFDDVVLLEFDSALPFEPLPSADQFTVRVNGVEVAIDRLSVAENGHTLVLFLENRVPGGAEVSISYADVSSQDDEVTLQGVTGADVADFETEITVGGEADPAPQLQSMRAFDEVILLDFDSALPFEPLPSVGQFTVRVNGVVVQIERLSVAENGHMLVLVLDEPVRGGAEVSVSYADVSAQDDEVTLQGVTGSDVANFEAETEAEGEAGGPPELQAMTVLEDRVSLRFDVQLSVENLPSLDQFTVMVAGVQAAVAELSVSDDGQTLILTLAEPVETGAAVSVAYADVSAEDDEATLQGEEGADVANFQAEAEAGTGVAPVLEAVTVQGNRVALRFDAALSTEGLPAISQFTIQVAGAPAVITAVSVGEDGETLVLTLAEPVVAGATVNVTYADVSVEDDEATLQGEEGADVANFQAETQAQAMGDGPRVVEAVADGVQIRLILDQLQDAARLPDASAFVVKVAGEIVEVESVGLGVGEHELVLTLDSAVPFGDAVTVSYADPTAGDDEAAIQATEGVDADSFDNLAVENLTAPPPPVLQSATVNGDSLVLTYDMTLDAGHGPDRAMFWVFVDGEQIEIDGVRVSGQTVNLNLSQSVTSGQRVQVSYFDDTYEMDDDYGIQSRDGADADTVIGYRVSHQSASSWGAMDLI